MLSPKRGVLLSQFCFDAVNSLANIPPMPCLSIFFLGSIPFYCIRLHTFENCLLKYGSRFRSSLLGVLLKISAMPTISAYP